MSLLTHGIHSGASGRVASSFRMMREVLDRVEDARTGEVLIRECHARIPGERLDQIRETARICDGDLADAPPWGAKICFEDIGHARVPPMGKRLRRNLTVDHIGHGPVVADEIQVYCGEVVYPMAQVPDQGQGFEEDFRQDHG